MKYLEINDYLCEECREKKNSDFDGRHEGQYGGYICDECEYESHHEFFLENTKIFRRVN